ncbi:MAG: tRNA (N(6)-L-threonylcarbamoyladenosine(37)-C(2))-methylthiotransferase MtaB, partial [Anaerovorax sp.]
MYTKKVDLSLDRDEFNQKYGRKKSLSTFTLGCKVNQYETQALKEKFEKAGYEVVAENAFADVYVINTCTVTSLSDKKSRQYIRRVKRINPDSITAVVGCYAQVSPAEAAGIEGVNIVAGTN